MFLNLPFKLKENRYYSKDSLECQPTFQDEKLKNQLSGNKRSYMTTFEKSKVIDADVSCCL